MDETTLQRVKVMGPKDLRRERIRRTPKNRAVIETMLELAPPTEEVLISQAEVALLIQIYERLRAVKFFRNWHSLLEADPCVAYFWALIKAVVTIEDPQERGNAWLKAYTEWDQNSKRWPETVWTRALTSFVRQETLLVYGMKIMVQKKQARQWVQ